MTADEFRSLALALPEAIEQSHMGHPDFRVGGKIFATLGSPDGSRGMVKLTPEQQELFTQAKPEMFAAVPGGWGKRGATHVILDAADRGAVYDALLLAWRNTAPKRLAQRHADL
jgi:hypothetical protein